MPKYVTIEGTSLVIDLVPTSNRVCEPVALSKDPFNVPKSVASVTLQEVTDKRYQPQVRRNLPFRAWLLKKKGLFDVVGDLSNDMNRDDQLPASDDPRVLYSYLKDFPASPNALRTFLRAWLAFNTGFKSLPLHEPMIGLRKSYALIAGIHEHPHFMNDYGDHIICLLVTHYSNLEKVITTLGLELPQPYPFNDPTDYEIEVARLTSKGYQRLGSILKTSRHHALRAACQLQMSYLEDDLLMRRLKLVEKSADRLKSTLENESFIDYPSTAQIDWFYGESDITITRFDQILLESVSPDESNI